jgi:GTP-binding protein HflX
VEAVLEALGCGVQDDSAQIRIEAWNKIDQLDDEEREDLVWRARLQTGPDKLQVIATSAITGQGLSALMRAIDEALSLGDERLHVRFRPSDAAARAWVHENGSIMEERMDAETGITDAIIRLSGPDAGRFRQRFPGLEQIFYAEHAE